MGHPSSEHVLRLAYDTASATMASYRASPFEPACVTKRGFVVASVMRPVLAYRDTVSMSPESMDRVVMSARVSRAEMRRADDDDDDDDEDIIGPWWW